MKSSDTSQHGSDPDESARSGEATAPLQEIEAMSKVAAALAEVDMSSVRRILRWAAERFGTEISVAAIAANINPAPTRSDPSAGEDLADLFARAAPSDGPERALVVGYWLQVIQGQEDLEGQTINSELKHFGHQLPNVTATMSLLMNQQPSLVMQTRKIGSTKQGRKRYKLTTSGITKVRQMLTAGQSRP